MKKFIITLIIFLILFITSCVPITLHTTPLKANTSQNETLTLNETKIIPDDNYTKIGDNNIVVVCEKDCPINQSLLVKSYQGARKAYDSMKMITGIDFQEELKPVHIHLMSDSICGSADKMLQDFGFLTGFATHEKTGEGAICLFNYEAKNRVLPFNEQNADKIQANLLTIHEFVHLLLQNTSTSYELQENFAKAISLRIAGFSQNAPIITSACDEHYKGFSDLSYLLCKQHNFDFEDYPLLFQRIQEEINQGKTPTNQDIKKYLDEITNHNTSDSFEQAEINLTNYINAKA